LIARLVVGAGQATRTGVFEGDMDQEPIRVLLVEDNPGDARLVRETLSEPGERPFHVIWVQTLHAGSAYLDEHPVDAILLDLTLPDSRGIETYRQLHDRAPEISTIILTGLDDETLALEAVRLGAQDFLRKGDACGNLLSRTIRYGLERKRIELALRASESRFHRMADNIQDGLLIIEQGKMIFYNNRACEIFGYTREEFDKQDLWTLLSPEELDPMRRMVDAERDASAFQRELGLWVVQKKGIRRYLQARISVHQQEDGVRNLYVIMTDITERKLREDELQYLSFHDSLTGLYNRAFFEESMDRLERGRQFPLSAIMVDIDGLKLVNDEQGHAAGDELLRRAAHAFRSIFRAEDMVARIGGDEFVALLPHTDAAKVEFIVARIKESVASHQPLSLSLGAATAEAPGGSMTQLIKLADHRMYEAKAAKALDRPAE
jgi:two-component system, cell cycle response regulator